MNANGPSKLPNTNQRFVGMPFLTARTYNETAKNTLKDTITQGLNKL